MRIGFDLDDTICNTDELTTYYQDIYIKEKKISADTLWNDMQYKLDFLKLYCEKIFLEAKLKESVKDVIDSLKDEGNEIYIITARSLDHIFNAYEVTKKYLENNSILFDKLIIKAGDKVNACIENKIDVMIDNSKYNFDMLVLNDVNAILYDEFNEYEEVENRVTGWNQMIRKIKEVVGKEE